jgi:hypothetical protein
VLQNGMDLFMMKMDLTQMNYKLIRIKERELKDSQKQLNTMKMKVLFIKNVIFSFLLHLSKQLIEYYII